QVDHHQARRRHAAVGLFGSPALHLRRRQEARRRYRRRRGRLSPGQGQSGGRIQGQGDHAEAQGSGEAEVDLLAGGGPSPPIPRSPKARPAPLARTGTSRKRPTVSRQRTRTKVGRPCGVPHLPAQSVIDANEPSPLAATGEVQPYAACALGITVVEGSLRISAPDSRPKAGSAEDETCRRIQPVLWT